jgi:hypothetical protein
MDRAVIRKIPIGAQISKRTVQRSPTAVLLICDEVTVWSHLVLVADQSERVLKPVASRIEGGIGSDPSDGGSERVLGNEVRPPAFAIERDRDRPCT